jgi:hypothetical protein
VTFVTLCEGYLGIEPHYELWRYFFIVSLVTKREKNMLVLSVHGVHDSPIVKVQQGWHVEWFYLKNDIAAPLLESMGHPIEEAPPAWGWGPLIRRRGGFRTTSPPSRS